MKSEHFYDVGVAGIHRLLRSTAEAFHESRVVIVLPRGMKSVAQLVVGGLVRGPGGYCRRH